MRRYLSLFVLLLLAIPLAACHSSPINGAALVPASQADVDALLADAKQDRENTAAGFDAVRKDLAAVQIATPETEKAHGAVVAKQEEVASRPASGGIPGALINALGGTLPGWLDWLLTLGATALGINTTRNASRKKALAKVNTPATGKPTTPAV